jgi:uncharacterized protein (TIRG00374 family)
VKKTFAISSVLTRLVFWLFIAAVAAITATVIFSDSARVLQLLKSIKPTWLLLILAAVLFNYLLRFGKWCYFLRLVKVRLPFRENLWVFLSAFTMVLSPGKIGELVKSFLLRGRYNVPVSLTAPVVMAERLTDLLGLMVLCMIGFPHFVFGGKTILLVGAFLALVIVGITRPWLWTKLEEFVAGFPRFNRLSHPIKIIQHSLEDLLTLRSLLFSTILSAISWAGEGFALFFIFQALKVDVPMLLPISIFAHAFSSIVGALSFLPGGLLVTEGTLGMFFVYAGIADAQAVSATFLIRAVTLWFAVILGTVVFLLGHTRADLAALQLIGNDVDEVKDDE